MLTTDIAFYTQTNKKRDSSWDFRNANTKEFTHCFHMYPAMMIPQVARRLIETYGKNSKVLFDPFCGTGTSLVEANLQGINAIGTDLNPLARLIALAKTTKVDIKVLSTYIETFEDYFFWNKKYLNVDDFPVIIPNVKNIHFWFSETAQKKLGAILYFIENNITDVNIKNFFKVAFSETVRDVSFLKDGEFKMVRSKKKKNIKNLDVFATMLKKLLRNKNGLRQFMEKVPSNVTSMIYDFNTVYEIPMYIPNSIDIVVTSPPYGDSRTTVAYGQFSRLSNEWLGINEANQVDNKLLGGRKEKYEFFFKDSILNEIIQSIKLKDEKRAIDVISFFKEYELSISNISKIVKKGGIVCYVVGNRTVKGITIPTDEITVQFFLNNNFVHIETIVRSIPNKRMPLKNSPSNIAGDIAPTMNHEFIVICQKK